jgi:hypothetical protein
MNKIEEAQMKHYTRNTMQCILIMFYIPAKVYVTLNGTNLTEV